MSFFVLILTQWIKTILSETPLPTEIVKYVAIYPNTKISMIYTRIQATNTEISSAKIKNIFKKKNHKNKIHSIW